jgi:hypothetical protein
MPSNNGVEDRTAAAPDASIAASHVESYVFVLEDQVIYRGGNR